MEIKLHPGETIHIEHSNLRKGIAKEITSHSIVKHADERHDGSMVISVEENAVIEFKCDPDKLPKGTAGFDITQFQTRLLNAARIETTEDTALENVHEMELGSFLKIIGNMLREYLGNVRKVTAERAVSKFREEIKRQKFYNYVVRGRRLLRGRYHEYVYFIRIPVTYTDSSNYVEQQAIRYVVEQTGIMEGVEIFKVGDPTNYQPILMDVRELR